LQPTSGFMTYVTCRLTAKYRDQLRNPTLGNRVWATFTFFRLELKRKLEVDGKPVDNASARTHRLREIRKDNAKKSKGTKIKMRGERNM